MTLATPIRPSAVSVQTVGDLLHQLGDVPAWRVLLHPAPGTATEDHVLDLQVRKGRLFELVDATLVEKGMGYRESLLATFLIPHIQNFVRPPNLGLVTGESGMLRLFAGLVRIPDVAYVSWARIPGGRVPTTPIPQLAPDLAVEVLSPSNTIREMERKRREYFESGVRLVWIVDPDARTVAVYTEPENPKIFTEADDLLGGEVLAGFAIPLRDLFAELDRLGGATVTA
jgi:Uma2 family endonuclease